MMLKLKFIKALRVLLFMLLLFCVNTGYTQVLQAIKNKIKTYNDLQTGADQTEEYLKLLEGKKVAIVANQTSLIKNTHLVDSLLSLKVNVKKIFCPEHGFRGDADAGEHVKNYKDKKTGLPVISLYGKNYKPKAEDLKDIDIIIFDIQDVGVRFYTYISTLHYVMEACAENNKKLIVFDRPNPNGYYVDGPVLNLKYKSFVGLHPVPIVYGMTIGEYGLMINGEHWLKDTVKCDIKIIQLKKYSHEDFYELPVKPSPNLPNMASVYLYPSLALFEGTVISVGRGTDFPFQIIGQPHLKNAYFSFTPKSKPGSSKKPMYKDTLCWGYDLRTYGDVFMKTNKKLYLFWLQNSYKNSKYNDTFFNNYFNKLAGNSILKQQIIDGITEIEIRKSWQNDLDEFKKTRKKYLLYEDFE